MDFSSKSKKKLKELAAELEIEVDAKKKNKPTLDELVTALEDYEKENGDEALKAAYEKLELADKEDTDEEDESEDTDEEEEVKPSKAVKGNVYTYVGKGETSPQKINFMGKQEFIRGRATEVTDKAVIAKIEGNPTFIKGKASPELLQEIEDEGIAVAEGNRAMDKRMDANFKKQHGAVKEK